MPCIFCKFHEAPTNAKRKNVFIEDMHVFYMWTQLHMCSCVHIDTPPEHKPELLA